MECSCVLPITQLGSQKCLSTNEHFRVFSIHLSGQEARIVQIDFDLLNHQPLIGSTIKAFSISSARCVLEVLCCL